jgi:hypothetical protein
VVAEELEGGLLRGWGVGTRGIGDVEDVLDWLADVGVAFDGDDAAGAGGHFLDVGESFSYLRTELESLGSCAAVQTTGRISAMRALGPGFISATG